MQNSKEDGLHVYEHFQHKVLNTNDRVILRAVVMMFHHCWKEQE